MVTGMNWTNLYSNLLPKTMNGALKYLRRIKYSMTSEVAMFMGS